MNESSRRFTFVDMWSWVVWKWLLVPSLWASELAQRGQVEVGVTSATPTCFPKCEPSIAMSVLLAKSKVTHV